MERNQTKSTIEYLKENAGMHYTIEGTYQNGYTERDEYGIIKPNGILMDIEGNEHFEPFEKIDNDLLVEIADIIMNSDEVFICPCCEEVLSKDDYSYNEKSDELEFHCLHCDDEFTERYAIVKTKNEIENRKILEECGYEVEFGIVITTIKGKTECGNIIELDIPCLTRENVMAAVDDYGINDEVLYAWKHKDDEDEVPFPYLNVRDHYNDIEQYLNKLMWDAQLMK